MSKDELLFPDNDSNEAETSSQETPISGHSRPWKILVTDDDPEVYDITALVLKGVSYKNRPIQLLNAQSSKEAHKILKQHPDIAVIFLDVVMETESAGLDLVHTIREELKNHEIRIVLRTGQPGQAPEKKVIVNYDINDYRAKTELTSQKLFSVTISALRGYMDIVSLKSSHDATVTVLAALAEYKDTDTGEHILRVGALSSQIARQLKSNGCYVEQLTGLFLKQIGPASMLHDVGKVGIPDSILLKPGRLDADERVVMEKHAVYGRDILDRGGETLDETSYLFMGAEVAATHHEHYDGSGYPKGLKGEEIPLSGRIVAVADVYDALTSKRPYKNPWPSIKAIEYIKDLSGKQFDPVVVEAFLDVMSERQQKAS